MLPDAAADGPGEGAGLERRDAHLTVELGAPGLLVSVDAQAQKAAAEVVTRSGASSAAPVRQVVGEPAAPIELGAFERLVELQLHA